MKKFFSTIAILILSNLAKASDLGLNTNKFENFTKQKGAVAMDGTGTCVIAGQNDFRKKSEFENLTLKDLRNKLQHTTSLQQQQEILDLVERTLVDENFYQK
ncbi:MAG: hypothetical protein ACXVCP_17110 [Bdellovibrio sp.]